MKHTATHCNTLQYIATLCNSLQRTATHYNTQGFFGAVIIGSFVCSLVVNEIRPEFGSPLDHSFSVVDDVFTVTATHCNTLQHTATHCNTLQHTAKQLDTLRYTATHCNTLQHAATRCNTLQHAATRCNTLQHAVTRCNTIIFKSRFWTTHLASWMMFLR